MGCELLQMCNEGLASVKGRELFEGQNKHSLLKKVPAPWS